MSRHSFTHRAEYLVARGLEGFAAALPERAAQSFAAAAGAFVHGALRIRRGVVDANLARAFPTASAGWRHDVARASFVHLARESAATLRLARLDAAGILARTEVVGWAELEAAARHGRGVILATGHLGNWEIGAAAIAARGLPTSAIVKRQSNPLFDARLDATRKRLGIETIDQPEASRLVPRALRAGRVVGIVADQDARRHGVWVPFFGRPSSTFRGPALFALRLGAPLFLAAALRLPDAARYRIVLRPLAAPRSGTLNADVLELTAELNRELEALIRTAPDQYFWFHRRWKTAPPTELTTAAAGTT